MERQKLVLKFGLNTCVVGSISLPSEGLAAIYVPMTFGGVLVCNRLETAGEVSGRLARQLFDIGMSCAVWHDENGVSVIINHSKGEDDGLTELRQILDKAGFDVEEVGGVPWESIRISQLN